MSAPLDAVVFACDGAHFPLALLAAERIAALEPEGGFDIVICLPQGSHLPPHQRSPRIRLQDIDPGQLPDPPLHRAWITRATYYRWILPGLFRGRYRSLLYLDTDTYLRRPGLGALFAGLEGPVPLAAVMDFQRLARGPRASQARIGRMIAEMGGRDGAYYNAGVLLIQPEPFAAADGPARFQDGMARNARFDPIYGEQDQGALNLGLADLIAPLHPRYNWCGAAWRTPKMVARYDPVLLHFAGPNKPWTRNDDPDVSAYLPAYEAFLQARFPPFTPAPAVGSSYAALAGREGGLLVSRVRAKLRKGRARRRRRMALKMDATRHGGMAALMAGARIGRDEPRPQREPGSEGDRGF